MITSVSFVCLLYIAVNICYMVVVPREMQLDPSGRSVAQSFFRLTFGSLSNEAIGNRIFNAFLAISSLGNIIVMTYTAARVKQQIAKEGILPWPKLFGSNQDISFGRFLDWAQRTPSIAKRFHRPLRARWLQPEEHRERTPVGALCLHLSVCLILIFATWHLKPISAYQMLSQLYAYLIDCVSGTFLGLGILILRLTPSRDWRGKAKHFNPILSVLTAFIYMIGNLFPVIATWIKPSQSWVERAHLSLKWFLVPTISWSVLGFSVLWWIVFVVYAKRREHKTSTVFTVAREWDFEQDPPVTGPPVQVHEKVYLSWVGKETLDGIADSKGTDLESVHKRNVEHPTDFDF